MQIVCRAWQEILSHIEGVPAEEAPRLAGLHQLVSQIATSRYADGLFAYMSHDELVIAQTDVVLSGQSRVFVLGSPGELTFVFADAANVELAGGVQRATLGGHPAWHTRCGEQDGFATLERFLERAGWFPRDSSRAGVLGAGAPSV